MWGDGEGSPFPDVKELADALVAAVRALEDRYRKVCLEAGNANTRIYQILKDHGPLHFYELILKSGLSRSSVHKSLLELKALGLVLKDERTDQWIAV